MFWERVREIASLWKAVGVELFQISALKKVTDFLASKTVLD